MTLMTKIGRVTMNNIEKADLVDKIRDVIAEHGWTIGAYQDEHGVCLLGAGRIAQGLRPTFHTRDTVVLGDSYTYMSANSKTAIALGLVEECEIFPYNVGAFNDKHESVEQIDDFLVNRSKELRELG